MVIHGKPSPSVGSPVPLPPAVTGFNGADVDVVVRDDVDDVDDLVVGGVVV